MTPRSTATRITEAIHRLETEADVWIATASGDGAPHLIPLSLAWDGSRILVSTPTASPTTRNIAQTGRARASLADTDDVVIVRAAAEAAPFADLPDAIAARFVDRVGWDPRQQSGGEWSLLTLTPEMVFAWKREPEIAGRTIMRGGEWVTD
jgi:hypothetical protein